VFNSVISAGMTLPAFLICVFTAIVLGVLSALVITARSYHTSSFAVSLAMLPAIVSIVIMLVNGNIGAGLAVAGTFALVRFRSVPGSAKEISGLFLNVSLGLLCGMGYVGFAVLFFIIMAIFIYLLAHFHFGEAGSAHRQLKITIPETLEFEGLFDDLFEKYTYSHELVRVRTTNMGTLYELTYSITLKSTEITKQFIDDIRCRNGNLNIICGREADRDMM